MVIPSGSLKNYYYFYLRQAFEVLHRCVKLWAVITTQYVHFSPSHLFCTLTVPPCSKKWLFLISSDFQQHSAGFSEPAFILMICSSHLTMLPQGQGNPVTILAYLQNILVRNHSRKCGFLPPQPPSRAMLHILILGSFSHFNFMGLLEAKW